MLKNYGYAGAYRNEDISVSILLENPLEHSLDVTELVFSVVMKGRTGSASRIEDVTFYIMDEADQLHNTQRTPYSKVVATDPDDDEPVRRPDGLIHTGFKHEFLFQDLRIAFYYRTYGQINIISLNH